MIFRDLNLIVFLRKVAIFLIYTFPFIPLFNIGSKVIQIEMLVFFLVLVAFIIELSKVNLKYLSKNNGPLIFVLWIFSLLTVISLFYTSDVILAQLQDLSYWILSLSPLILIKGKFNGNSPYDYVRCIMLSSIVGSIIVIAIKISSDTILRSTGFMSSANLAGALFALTCIISLGYYLEFKSKLFLSTFVINIVAIFATGSRESLLTVIISILIIGLLLLYNSRKHVIRWIIVLTTLIISSIFLLNSLFTDILHRYLVTLTSVFTGSESEMNLAFSDRLILWEELIDRLVENPITPLGFQGLSVTGTFGLYAHNMFLQALVIGGVIGLIAFLMLLVIIYKYCIKNYKKQPSPVSASILALIIGYSLTGMVSDHFLNFFTWNFVMFTVLKQQVESLLTKNGV
ncbi:O-antigen ligase family protein [Marinilactibacillus psychrotolerans]|uniref:O-antigen ligase family protein n=1 Tax=Marinilactibacillus psychrotolerans TaxID=191770 RepID=A0ABW8UPC0_9LACT